MNTPRLPARPATRWLLFILSFGLAASLWAPSASAADNTIVSSTPAAGSTVDTFAGPIELTFAQQVGPDNEVVMTCDGAVVQLGTPAPLIDGMTVSVALVSPAPKGSCTIVWTVTDPGLQPAGSGSLTFSVASDTVAAETTVAPTGPTLAPGETTTTSTAPPITVPSGGGGGSTNLSGPLGLFRLVSNFGLAVLFGSLVVIVIAWPEGVEYVLTIRFLRTAWIVAAISSYLFAGSVSAAATGEGLGSTLSPGSLFDLLDTGEGKAAFLRLVFVLISGYVVMQPERAIDPATQLPALIPPGIAVVTMAFSRPEFGFIDYAAGIVHVLGMSVWLGGLVLLSRVVLAGPGEEDLVHAVRGFSRIATPALIATVASGAIQFVRLDRGALGTSHGMVMILKVMFVSGMVFVGVATRQFIAQRMTRVETMSAHLSVRLRRALGIEATIGLVVILLTAWLLALTPPGLGAAGNSLDLGPRYQFENTSIAFEVSVSFSERVGPNDVEIEVLSAPPTGLTGLAIDFIPPATSGVNGLTINNIPFTGTGKAVLEKADGFTLLAAGTWTIVVRLGDTVVASQDVLVKAADG
ncbi:MAG: CopD family protein [Actinobacteria bacterium]|nr:CopD family protein [Actinomycetota bacterium]